MMTDQGMLFGEGLPPTTTGRANTVLSAAVDTADIEVRFDLEEGERLAEEGMRKALRAERVQAWREMADAWLEEVPWGTRLTADDLVEAIGLPELEDGGQNRNNVLGGWFSGKAKAGLIQWEGGMSKSKRPERHGNHQRVWVRLAKEDTDD